MVTLHESAVYLKSEADSDIYWVMGGGRIETHTHLATFLKTPDQTLISPSGGTRVKTWSSLPL